MIVEIERTYAFCVVEIIVAEEQYCRRHEIPVFVNIVKIIFDIDRVIFPDFVETNDFCQDALFVSELRQSVSPLSDAFIVRSDDEVVAAFKVVNSQRTTVNSIWIYIPSAQCLLSVDCCLLT